MIRRIAVIIGIVAPVPMLAGEADRSFVLAAPPELLQSGVIDHLKPRFSLKTGIAVTLKEAVSPEGQRPAKADLWFTTAPLGEAVLSRGAQTWHLGANDDPDAGRFLNWLSSTAGRAAIDGFAPPEGPPYRPAAARRSARAAPPPEGDAEAGATLALDLCGRCHVVGRVNRMKGIGSTPSFALLRGFADWQTRFAAFHALNPHPSFTQVEDVTPPFDPRRPSPIAPMRLDLEELEAIIAYVAGLAPADLGAPLDAK
ncbi:hypothetical protein [Profundibacterium mesophilum]|uniref:Cytochrome c family domain containing protein n=1 Tax=Profundibacterium mesophilum KAUST100406-0324 TaxID=1037889 RepID=A0A921NWH6_9RHOB|nr:hypothetical protein [Profundibacterium mesophilum]KAF0676953.1 Cytochrome c family domain containing protein [Profundibacterium mesophilum KAUST100406-0324]